MYKVFLYREEQDENNFDFAPQHLLVNMDLVTYIDFSIYEHRPEDRPRLNGVTLHFNSGEIKVIPANTDLNNFEDDINSNNTTIIRCYK